MTLLLLIVINKMDWWWELLFQELGGCNQCVDVRKGRY